MKNVIATLALFALVTSCASGSESTSTTGAAVTTLTTAAAETTSTTAFTLTPLGDTPEEVEAEFVRLLREWSARQPTDPYGQPTDQELVDTGRLMCEGVARVEKAVEDGYIMGFRTLMIEDFEADEVDGFDALYFRAIFILCPEYGEELGQAILDELEG